MKKFNEKVNENATNVFASNNKLESELYRLINENSKIVKGNEIINDKNLYLDGTKELVEKIEKIIEIEEIKKEIQLLEKLKKQTL